MPLQLDQLRLTVGSPAGAAEEDDQRPPSRALRVEIDEAPVLIGEAHVGKMGTDGGPHHTEVDRR